MLRQALHLARYIIFRIKILKPLLGGYYQTGKTENNLLLSAYMINIMLSCMVRIFFGGLGFDYLSGSYDKTSLSHSQSFSPYMPPIISFMDYMDYFINIPCRYQTKRINRSLLCTSGITAVKNFKVRLDVHHFY